MTAPRCDRCSAEAERLDLVPLSLPGGAWGLQHRDREACAPAESSAVAVLEVVPAPVPTEPTPEEADRALTAAHAVEMALTVLDAVGVDAEAIDPTGLSSHGLWTARAIYPLLDEVVDRARSAKARAGAAISRQLERSKARSTVLGGAVYAYEATPGSWVYPDPGALRDALATQVAVGLLSADEVAAAVPQTVTAAGEAPCAACGGSGRVTIAASVRTVVDYRKLEPLLRSRGEALARIVSAFRTRDLGSPILKRK